MKKKQIMYVLSEGPVGSLPAPGTCASLTIFCFLFLFRTCFLSFYWYFVLTVSFIVVGWVLVHYAYSKGYLISADPPEIVVDECAGMLVTYFGIELSNMSLIIGLILFRIFDIYKPFGIAYIERYTGAFGIMGDDLAAGLMSNVILRIFCYMLGCYE